MQILKFSNSDQQAAALAKLIAEAICQQLKQKPQICLAVSGGKSPIKFFQNLSNIDLAWERVSLTLVDERFVAADHPDSNQNLLKSHLLIKRAEKASFIGLLSDYQQSILANVTNANLQVPKIDIAVLGMGEDGHTASLFPCCAEISNALDCQLTPERYIITNPTSANHQRIGLSLAGILEIPQLFISLNGATKLAVLEKAAAEANNPNYPISYVLSAKPNAQVLWSA